MLRITSGLLLSSLLLGGCYTQVKSTGDYWGYSGHRHARRVLVESDTEYTQPQQPPQTETVDTSVPPPESAESGTGTTVINNYYEDIPWSHPYYYYWGYSAPPVVGFSVTFGDPWYWGPAYHHRLWYDRSYYEYPWYYPDAYYYSAWDPFGWYPCVVPPAYPYWGGGYYPYYGHRGYWHDDHRGAGSPPGRSGTGRITGGEQRSGRSVVTSGNSGGGSSTTPSGGRSTQPNGGGRSTGNAGSSTGNTNTGRSGVNTAKQPEQTNQNANPGRSQEAARPAPRSNGGGQQAPSGTGRSRQSDGDQAPRNFNALPRGARAPVAYGQRNANFRAAANRNYPVSRVRTAPPAYRASSGYSAPRYSGGGRGAASVSAPRQQSSGGGGGGARSGGGGRSRH